MARRLLERDQELATLLGAAREAASGSGSVVLLHGEAGIGKTSLVSALRSELPDGTRMLVGSCDALSTPRTLGPFRDLTAAVGPRLAEALPSGERDQVMDALLTELHQPPPSTLVIEDVHWADEATVDTLRFLVRRICQLSIVLLLTYRDDELSRDRPLTQLLGDASHADQVHHLSPQRLPEPAVRELVADSALDVDEVFALSDGNPYFISELVASAVGSSVPLTVVDAVLGRLRRLWRGQRWARSTMRYPVAITSPSSRRWLLPAPSWRSVSPKSLTGRWRTGLTGKPARRAKSDRMP